MIRAVLDTNQYVSMAIKAGGTADRLLAAWREERFVLLLSPPILDEISRVLRSPRLRRLIRLTTAELNSLIESLLFDAELTPGRLAVDVVTRDPSDNMFPFSFLLSRARHKSGTPGVEAELFEL